MCTIATASSYMRLPLKLVLALVEVYLVIFKAASRPCLALPSEAGICCPASRSRPLHKRSDDTPQFGSVRPPNASSWQSLAAGLRQTVCYALSYSRYDTLISRHVAFDQNPTRLLVLEPTTQCRQLIPPFLTRQHGPLDMCLHWLSPETESCS